MKKFRFIKSFLIFSLCALPVCADVSVRLMPDYYIAQDTKLNNSFEGTVSFDFSPITIRKRDSIYFSLQGTAAFLQADGISDFNYFSGDLGAGYEFRFADRFSAAAEGFGGLWFIPENDKNGFGSASGILYGGRLMVNFFAVPEFSIGLFGGMKALSNGSSNFMTSTELGLSLRYNFSKGFQTSSNIETKNVQIDNVFPVFYSHYIDNSFGTYSFINGEKNKITDIEVSIFVEQFMSNPYVVAEIPVMAIGEEQTVNLKAFLNESILNQILPSNSYAQVSVTYRSLGKKVTNTEVIEFTTLGRNNMSWDEDERAAAFVSGKDATANKFANLVRVILRDKVDTSKNLNEQYARGIYAALKAFGLNYVIDPSSSFKDNAGTSSVDFLQFPYQTILYHGGDCDDLTILNCSMMEALGIDSAMITTPGHIFMAFDSGYKENEKSMIADGIFIAQNGKLWIPVEITLCQSTYANAKSTAIKEWKKAGKEAKLIPLSDAWKKYKPVSIPDSDVEFEIPATEKILKYY